MTTSKIGNSKLVLRYPTNLRNNQQQVDPSLPQIDDEQSSIQQGLIQQGPINRQNLSSNVAPRQFQTWPAELHLMVAKQVVATGTRKDLRSMALVSPQTFANLFPLLSEVRLETLCRLLGSPFEADMETLNEAFPRYENEPGSITTRVLSRVLDPRKPVRRGIKQPSQPNSVYGLATDDGKEKVLRRIIYKMNPDTLIGQLDDPSNSAPTVVQAIGAIGSSAHRARLTQHLLKRLACHHSGADVLDYLQGMAKKIADALPPRSLSGKDWNSIASKLRETVLRVQAKQENGDTLLRVFESMMRDPQGHSDSNSRAPATGHVIDLRTSDLSEQKKSLEHLAGLIGSLVGSTRRAVTAQFLRWLDRLAPEGPVRRKIGGAWIEGLANSEHSSTDGDLERALEHFSFDDVDAARRPGVIAQAIDEIPLWHVGWKARGPCLKVTSAIELLEDRHHQVELLVKVAHTLDFDGGIQGGTVVDLAFELAVDLIAQTMKRCGISPEAEGRPIVREIVDRALADATPVKIDRALAIDSGGSDEAPRLSSVLDDASASDRFTYDAGLKDRARDFIAAFAFGDSMFKAAALTGLALNLDKFPKNLRGPIVRALGDRLATAHPDETPLDRDDASRLESALLQARGLLPDDEQRAHDVWFARDESTHREALVEALVQGSPLDDDDLARQLEPLLNEETLDLNTHIGIHFKLAETLSPGLAPSPTRHQAARRVFGQMMRRHGEYPDEQRGRLAYQLAKTLADIDSSRVDIQEEVLGHLEVLAGAPLGTTRPMLATQLQDLLSSRDFALRERAQAIINSLGTPSI
jgi:hypothetical protein